jgi:hypothetical protein
MVFAAAMPERLALITALILNRGLCLSCVVTKTLMSSTDELTAALDRIGHVLVVHRSQGQCEMCSRNTEVVSVSRPE